MVEEIESLQRQIDDLGQGIAVSGIPGTSLMGKMLASSLAYVKWAYENRDFESVIRGLENTKSLLNQCTL